MSSINVTRSHRRSPFLHLGAVLLCAVVLFSTTPVHAESKPDAGCTLEHPKYSTSEFLTCVTAVASLDRVPTVGETARLAVKVDSQVEAAGATLSIGLPDSLSMVSSGYSKSVAHRNALRDETLSRPVNVTKRVQTFTAIVRANMPGDVYISVDVSGPGITSSAGDELAVNIAPAGGRSARSGPGSTTAKAVSAPMSAQNLPAESPHALAAQEGGTSSSPGASCASGGWTYQDQAGAWHNAQNISVQIWDDDTFGGDDLLASGLTGADGRFNLCFESSEDGNGGPEVYVRFRTTNGMWRVRNDPTNNQTYQWTTGTVNYTDPMSHSFGTLTGDAASQRGLHAFAAVDKMWLWMRSANPYFDNPGEKRQLVINWTPTSDDGTYYAHGDKSVHLKAADPDSETTVIHESSHALMGAVYNDNWPPDAGGKHSIWGEATPSLAWAEAFAEWIPALVLRDPFFRWPDGAWLNFETASWSGFDTDGGHVDAQPGDKVEGHVAAALIDLSDQTNEAWWDRYGEGGPGAVDEESYLTFLNTWSSDFNDFINNDRPAAGHPLDYYGRASIWQNAIEYNHRDPLVNLKTLTRPRTDATPVIHYYSLRLDKPYWGGMAIRSPKTDKNLDVYDDEAVSHLIGSSHRTGSQVDYVVFDGNGRASGNVFGKVQGYQGWDNYEVEGAVDAVELAYQTQSVSLGSSRIIKLRDMSVVGGQPNFVRIVPPVGQDVDLFVHDSSGTNRVVQDPGQALASSVSHGAGQAEAVKFTLAEGDRAGLVMLNRAGSGVSKLYRDVTAPTSNSVTINGGARSTTSATVTLTLTSTDTQTGLWQMRISTDGLIDTEPFQTFTTSRSVTLPSGAGTKTVRVQFRNNAGMTSPTVVDSITLIQ